MPTARRRSIHAAKISHVETSFLPTGVLGVGTNKGAVALALSLREARLCVVNCHLAAHHEKLLQRNTDVQQICKHLRLGAPQVEIPSQVTGCHCHYHHRHHQHHHHHHHHANLAVPYDRLR